jgi:hypothetical protein
VYHVEPPSPSFSAPKFPIDIERASDIRRHREASAAASTSASLPATDTRKPGRDARAQPGAATLAAQLAQTVMLPLMFHRKTPGDYAGILLRR